MAGCSLAVPSYAFAGDTTPVTLESDTCTHLDEVVVTGLTGKSRLKEIPAPMSVISHDALFAHPATNIIDAISRQPGMNQVTTGSGISKPIIRGLGYNRVLVVNDGVRQEGQQWGDEHGIELDGQAVNRVEILKGPASLTYGSDAMAGVIIMHDAPVAGLNSNYAEAGTEYQSNNGLLGYTLNIRGNREDFVWNWRWSQKFAHDYHAPLDGTVPNTRFREQALKGTLGILKPWGYSNLKLSYYHLTPGLTDVDDQLPQPSDSYSILLPYQKVYHYKAISDNSFNLGASQLKVILGYQQNRRREFEHAHSHSHSPLHGDDHDHDHDHETESGDHCGLDLRLHTFTYDAKFISPIWNGWKFNFGANGMFQNSENLGIEFLIPDYSLFDIGVFATVSKSLGTRFHLSGGLRYDHRHLNSKQLIEENSIRFEAFKRNFGSISGSIGMIYNLNSMFDFKVNIARGFRAPNISELGSNGSHEGTFRFEKGDDMLKSEESWQFDLGADFVSRYVSASLSLFANRISNFIYLQATGATAMEVPVYQYSASDARLLGGEAVLTFHPIHHLHIQNTFSYVNATRLGATGDSRYLPFTPAPRLISSAHYDIPVNSNIVKNLFAEVENDLNFRQYNVMATNGTERPSPAYTLLNLSAGTDIYLSNGKKLCQISFAVTNLLDRAYQSHLSRLRYAETFPLTGRYGFNNPGRNFTIKLLFPLSF